MPDAVAVLAYAKLNLSLDITGLRPDGYHTLEMVMQSVDLHDTVTVIKADSGIEVLCNNDDIPEGKDNIAFKAADEFIKYTQLDSCGVQIKIKKRIPAAAGLGGGSADAAAVLVGMNELFNTQLDYEQLYEIGYRLGSDVPFCITGGTQLAEGIGTILTPLPNLDNCCFVIIKEGKKPSTGEMYKRFDSLKNVTHPLTSILVDCICEGDLEQATAYMSNVFEPLWSERIKKIKDDLIECSALTTTLSGSGPSVLGVFHNEDEAHKCKNALDEKYKEIFVCLPKSVGCEID